MMRSLAKRLTDSVFSNKPVCCAHATGAYLGSIVWSSQNEAVDCIRSL